MKTQSLAQILSAVAIALGVTATINQLSYAEETPTISQPNRLTDTRFFCDQDNGVFTTFADSSARGGTIPVIRWVTQINPKFPPEVRCKQVSDRFQQYYNDGRLSYITTGVMNGQPVVCVTSSIGGRCTGLLFTLVNLDNRQNASRALQQLFDISSRAAGPLLESEDPSTSEDTSNAPIYIDIKEYLNKAPLVGSHSPNYQPSVTPSTTN